MKLAIMQPYILPYIGYFQLLNAVDKFVIYDDVNYINKGWINRNQLLINNKSSLFTIPLINASQNRLINEISIDQSSPWKRKLIKSVELAYKKAPQYNDIFPLFKEILMEDTHQVSLFITQALKVIAHYLEIDTDIVVCSPNYQNKNLTGQERILDICNKEKATTYINPINGSHLYSYKLFRDKGIDLRFIQSKDCSYQQFAKDFVPWLSIIDVLMFNSKDDCIKLLQNYKLS